MNFQHKKTLFQSLKKLIIGRAHSPEDQNLFHKLSLIAFFAWIGLGADGFSSSCYGPEEAFLALRGHTYLSIFVALGSALTIFVIGESYKQIIELFSTGGGGYFVASKLLSPTIGMISGCALLVDYVLTITLSIASGTDALFSFLPPEWHSLKLAFAFIGVTLLTLLNMRGVKESVIPLVPIFMTFVIAHAFVILYALVTHLMNLSTVVNQTIIEVNTSYSQVGLWGIILLLLRSYSMGAGTYTGIEAVSNGLPILREPRVKTGKRTMNYMMVSLALTVVGLMLAYLLYKVEPHTGKTLNAVLFENITEHWNKSTGHVFLLVILFSEAALLFVAAQTGFLDGPRVLANMALDRWFPSKFSMLSDRFVTQNGIFLMGLSAFILMYLSRGSVRFLVVLYSINVFVTFSLSQMGMVRHWFNVRNTEMHWKRKLLINGIGLVMTASILLFMIIMKFYEGGWITILITGTLVILVLIIRGHYNYAGKMLSRLNNLVSLTDNFGPQSISGITVDEKDRQPFDPRAETAVLLVSGFTGLGLHTLFNVIRTFRGSFKNYIFIQIGVIDAGNFKGQEEIKKLQEIMDNALKHYVSFMKKSGYHAESFSSIGVDIVDESAKVISKVLDHYPHIVVFGGKIVFPNESVFTRLLHNYTIFAVQRRLYQQGIPVVIMPILVK